MKILVTGATGFVGKHLCSYLTGEGNSVFALARNKNKFNNLKIQGKLVEGNLSEESIIEWINELPNDLEVVIHNAGIVHSFENKDFYDVNYGGTKILVQELAKKFQKKIKFIFISSLAVSGPNRLDKEFISESDGYSPISNYGHSKFLAELILKKLAPPEWKCTILRPSIVIGPDDEAFNQVIEMVDNGVVLFAGLNGKNKKYSFISVYDLIEGILQCIVVPQRASFQDFFISYPKPVSYGHIIDEIQLSLNKDKVRYFYIPIFVLYIFSIVLLLLNKISIHLNIRITPDKIKELAPNSWVCSSEKSMETLEIKYTRSLSDCINGAVQAYLKKLNGDFKA